MLKQSKIAFVNPRSLLEKIVKRSLGGGTSEPDSVSESESSNDDSGTECGNNDSPGSRRGSAYDTIEAGESDLHSPVRILTSTRGEKHGDTFLYLILRNVNIS